MSVGADIPRVDGLDKLTGRAAYVDDVAIPGVLHGGTIRTPIARGRIQRVVFDPAINWSDFVIVDHRDIPAGRNAIKLIEADQPALVADEFRHKHEPVVLIAHRSIHKLRDALRAVRVEVEPLPAVLRPDMPLTPELLQHGSDNVLKRLAIRKGAGEPGREAEFQALFDSAAHIIEGRYATGAQEHVYLETQGMVAWQEDGRLVVRGSMQCPYYVVDSLAYFFNRPREAFRVIQAPVGGGFGGKEDFPSNLAIHAALLAEKAGAPVKIVYDRQEDMAATTKRHPGVVRHRTAVDASGKLLAMDIDVVMDGGAYVTLSPVVLSRGCIHAAGPYACENIRAIGEARLTNSVPYGAFRGFGAPQTMFAIERHMDVIARRIGMSSVELRRRNLVRDGQTLATGQVVSDGVDLPSLMDAALTDARYDERQKLHADMNSGAGSHPYLRRGIGFATFHHGSGFTGGGETYLASEVWVEGHADGRVEVLTAQTDMGQGTSTILSQIAAAQLGVSADLVRVATPDTSRVPNSGPTVASRTAMVVGKLVEAACDDLLKQSGIGTTKSIPRDPSGAIKSWHAANPGKRLIGRGKYEKPAHIQWDDKSYRGDAYAAYSWGTYVAEVEVDLRTFAVRVTDFVARQEVGRVLNPTLARGQIQGGVVQGIGWALYEEVVLDDGVMKNCQMTNYVIPACADLPPIRVFFEESPSPFGPQGAKGIGELPMDGPAPAILNAVCDALGIEANEIPLTPERLMTLLEGR
ncbi:putative xanthine dehydrogenase subunit D [Phycisphaerae bacterium RAS2]|nr:putative xanthine dehydrogenase subunit D [Phycisphaerae bacterium RAS2]